MFVGQLALVVAGLFSGAALYVSLAEHPARMALDDRASLAQWKPSYRRGFAMQATLAVVGFALGALEWYFSSDWRWLLGAIVLVSNWPYTVFAIMPTNKRLMDTPLDTAGPESRRLMISWGKLHAVRTALGVGSTAIFVWALT